MRIELLTAPHCPNADEVRKLVVDCLTTLDIKVPIIDRVGSYASPTVLVDGVDVMRPEAGAPIGNACRLDLPTRQRVLDALRAPQSVATAAQHLPPAIRELHRAVLRAFRDYGRASRGDLQPTAAALGVDLDDALHRLATADLVHSAPDGQIEIAYPFSSRPTGHTVHLTGHPRVAAMCAVDALGVPLMTGIDGVIDSADPDTGAPIQIRCRGDEWSWQPATTVVVIGHTDFCGSLADTVCRSITFHTDAQQAQSHLGKHPELHGHVVGHTEAIALADYAFRGLLD